MPRDEQKISKRLLSQSPPADRPGSVETLDGPRRRPGTLASSRRSRIILEGKYSCSVLEKRMKDGCGRNRTRRYKRQFCFSKKAGMGEGPNSRTSSGRRPRVRTVAAILADTNTHDAGLSLSFPASKSSLLQRLDEVGMSQTSQRWMLTANISST